MRNHGGHELRTVEHIRIQGGRLNYKHEITGPGGKYDESEVVFNLSEQQ